MNTAFQIAIGIWGGGVLIFGTVWAVGEARDFVKHQKYSGIEWYRWKAARKP